MEVIDLNTLALPLYSMVPFVAFGQQEWRKARRGELIGVAIGYASDAPWSASGAGV